VKESLLLSSSFFSSSPPSKVSQEVYCILSQLVVS
jgi:hypothetical protein